MKKKRDANLWSLLHFARYLDGKENLMSKNRWEKLVVYKNNGMLCSCKKDEVMQFSVNCMEMIIILSKISYMEKDKHV